MSTQISTQKTMVSDLLLITEIMNDDGHASIVTKEFVEENGHYILNIEILKEYFALLGGTTTSWVCEAITEKFDWLKLIKVEQSLIYHSYEDTKVYECKLGFESWNIINLYNPESKEYVQKYEINYY